MKFTGEEWKNEIGQERQEQRSQTSPTFDDIYVPGIGVRAALDDDDRPAKLDLLPRIGERSVRAAEFMYLWAVRTTGSLKNVGFRLATGLKASGAEILAAMAQPPKPLLRMTKATFWGLRTAHGCLSNATGGASAGFRKACGRMSTSAQLAANAVTRGVQAIEAWWLQLMRSAPVQRARRYRLSLPPIPPIVASARRSLRRAQSSLRSTVIGVRNRQRPSANRVRLRIHPAYKSDFVMLRRATPALAVLLVIVMFVIQEVMTVVKR